MTWFRTKHVQITDLAEGSNGWAQTGVYADGEWHASACLDTIPADSATVLALGPARLVVPPAAWQAADSHTFTYVAGTPTRLWHVSIDIDRGTWWVWLLDQDASAWRGMDNFPIDMRFNDRVAHESLPLRAPSGQDDTVAYYQAGVAPMTCFSVSTLSANRSHARDWWSSYVMVRGVYNLSDCRQSKGLSNVGARLRVGWTSLVVPVSGFKPAARGWYTYAHQSNTLTWWLSVHPRSGAFWAHVWSTASDISTSSDGRVDISLQLSDQLGETHVQGQRLVDTTGYVVHGDVRGMCPTQP